jgi:hypothetical protein
VARTPGLSKRDISTQETNIFQARRQKNGWKSQPEVAGERSQNPWYMRMENKGAGQDRMGETKSHTGL